MTDIAIDHTHAADARSWVESGNQPGADFPVQNLPVGVFRRKGGAESFRAGVAIGDQIFDLSAAGANGILGRSTYNLIKGRNTLNQLVAQGRPAFLTFRHELFALLRQDANQNPDLKARAAACLVPQSEAEYALPTSIGDYTDFYTSSFHATNIMRLMKPNEPPLSANFQHMPIAYHGRASSVGVSGQNVWRPMGQALPSGSEPVYGPCQKLDFELELGFVIGPGNARGERIKLDDAEQHIVGLCLLNDWSARDIQFWESVPLGPFLAKNFATTVSPWLVTLEALAPFRQAQKTRTVQDPVPLPYLHSAANDAFGALDIRVSAGIQTSKMRSANQAAAEIMRTSFSHQYWTIAQMLAHHSVGGCQLRPGDLLGTGTISGPGEGEAGALIELSKNGIAPVALPNGEKRGFLADGDAVVLKAWCERPGFARIGFGESRGTVLAAMP